MGTEIGTPTRKGSCEEAILEVGFNASSSFLFNMQIGEPVIGEGHIYRFNRRMVEGDRQVVQNRQLIRRGGQIPHQLGRYQKAQLIQQPGMDGQSLRIQFALRLTRVVPPTRDGCCGVIRPDRPGILSYHRRYKWRVSWKFALAASNFQADGITHVMVSLQEGSHRSELRSLEEF